MTKRADGQTGRRALTILLIALSGCAPVKLDWAHAPPPPELMPLDSLAAQLTARIAGSGATVGLYYKDLARPESLTISADLRFHAASTMKVPVMIQVFRDAESGRLSLDSQLVVRNEFRSLADGSTYQLDKADDSDSSLYDKVGTPMKVRDLVELMITVSSNLATNNLIDVVSAARVNATLRALGIDSVDVKRGVEDGPAFRAGINNTLTARGLGLVFASLADGSAAGATSCAQMLEVLLRQRFNDRIPAGLPEHTKVAHKTGDITGANHDGGIVYMDGRPRYVLVVLTRGINDQKTSSKLIADLAGMIHTRLTPTPPPPVTPVTPAVRP